MSKKNLDPKNRLRSRIISFRVSPEEWTQIDHMASLSGLNKQDYLCKRALCQDIEVRPNARVMKALKCQLIQFHNDLKIFHDVEDMVMLATQMATVIDGMNGGDLA